MDKTVYTYAGFWKRFIAYIIDSIILNIAIGIVFIPILLLGGLPFLQQLENFEQYQQSEFSSISYMQGTEFNEFALVSAFLGFILFIIVLATVISWLYFALMESSSKKATLGKMAIGLIVTDMQGVRLTFGRATGRYFGKILSGLILNIGYIMAAFTEKKQALHDMLAGTLVLEVKRQVYTSYSDLQ